MARRVEGPPTNRTLVELPRTGPPEGRIGHSWVQWLRNRWRMVPYGPDIGAELRRKPARGRGSASTTGALVARNSHTVLSALYSQFSITVVTAALRVCGGGRWFCCCCKCRRAVGGRRGPRSSASCLRPSDSRGCRLRCRTGYQVWSSGFGGWSGVDLPTGCMVGPPGRVSTGAEPNLTFTALRRHPSKGRSSCWSSFVLHTICGVICTDFNLLFFRVVCAHSFNLLYYVPNIRFF